MSLKEIAVLAASAFIARAQELPGTKAFTGRGDQAELMLSGMHAYLDRQTLASATGRDVSDVGASRRELRRALGIQDL